jgi:ABC-type glycerol-3-phosphate transport system substrate-binding protein
VRSVAVVAGAVLLLALAGCETRDEEPESAAPRPITVEQPPAASAGGACILWDYAFIKQKIGVAFDVAASDQVDDTSTCVVQTAAGDYPDLMLSIVESTKASPEQFLSDLKPAQASKLKGLGKAAYRLYTPPAAGHGPSLEIGWLSEAKQLQTLRFTFDKKAPAAAVSAMNPKLIALAKAMDTTDG